ncbi:hypothetical protein [Microbacterium sp. ZXX196]|uniref:hypothetical protein n=1 Tax=Microbacterium sp. ZXX196 TaxID=2609291 RepID=UPI0012B77669|nr:hypothetical protein [Microbacterium sp. ZXX196]MTE24142.1 hypothetical protein [Microbacterium sp. ZXX196]
MLATLDIWPHPGPRVTRTPFSERDVDEAWSYPSLPEVTTWRRTWLASRDAWQGDASRAKLVGRGLAARAGGALVGDATLTLADGWGQGGSDPAAVSRCEAEVGCTRSTRASRAAARARRWGGTAADRVPLRRGTARDGVGARG